MSDYPLSFAFQSAMQRNPTLMADKHAPIKAAKPEETHQPAPPPVAPAAADGSRGNAIDSKA